MTRTRTLPGDSETLEPGTRVGDFEIEAAHNEGGFAAVYRARHQDRVVALKLLHPHLAAAPATRDRFLREADILRRLDHPRIVSCISSGLADGRPYVAMEWIDGPDLAAELARRGPLTSAEAIDVLSSLADALDAAHAVGLVHRDVKAENVMVRPDGDWFDITLVDFGIAKELDSTTTSSALYGTPLTMAPEQIRGLSVDPRTDVYALGILAYQLVTGRLPFTAPTLVEIEELHLTGRPPRPSERAPVPPAYDALVDRCLRKSPLDRFPNMSTLRAAALATLRPVTRLELRLADPAHPDAEAALATALATCIAAGASIEVSSPNGYRLIIPSDPAPVLAALTDPRVEVELIT